MSQAVIKVEHLGKKFIIGHQTNERYTALRDVVANNAKGVIRRAKQLVKQEKRQAVTTEEFWALRDINFEINSGDRVGIIGRNGAGKSTLLKVLSRITEPTEGRITIRGRVASLLEVGTGFHPELSGRENIFLNGAILGMSRAEIRQKFDEIVAFAEIERFLDTPVKRYSSGMYVRLAFAVAAHLEPEILIVDEVLAVGDAQFQKKCLGKMEDVSRNDGRTILFVSHNMGVVSQLCNKGFLLNKGRIVATGKATEIIDKYVAASETGSSAVYETAGSDKPNQFLKIFTSGPDGTPRTDFAFNENLGIHLEFKCDFNVQNQQVGIGLNDKYNNRIFTLLKPVNEFKKSNGVYSGTVVLPSEIIAPNFYSFVFAIWTQTGEVFDLVENACKVRIHDNGTELAGYEGIEFGSVILKPTWQ
jgi:lipopolysaccharide transport system ATP-binding protein